MITKFQLEHWDQNFNVKVFDHNTTLPDTRSQIPMDSHIYVSEATV